MWLASFKVKSLCWAILLQLWIGTQSEELRNPTNNVTDRVFNFNRTVQSLMEKLHDGISEVTHDQDGNPMVSVNGSQIMELSLLLMEQDEGYLSDWPGHETINNSLTGHVHPRDKELLKQMVDQPPKLVRVRRSLFYPKATLWPNGVVPYVFDENINDVSKSRILQMQKVLAERVPCIKYVPLTAEDLKPQIRNDSMMEGQPKFVSYLLITDKGPGCNSMTGSRNGPTVLNLAAVCKEKAAVHELMHSLGVAHEIQRPDRDDYIDLNLENIQPKMRQFYSKFPPETIDEDWVEYDLRSAMHGAGFSINSSIPLVIPKPPNQMPRDLPMMNPNFLMSPTDYKGLRIEYGCPDKLKNDEEYEIEKKKIEDATPLRIRERMRNNKIKKELERREREQEKEQEKEEQKKRQMVQEEREQRQTEEQKELEQEYMELEKMLQERKQKMEEQKELERKEMEREYRELEKMLQSRSYTRRRGMKRN